MDSSLDATLLMTADGVGGVWTYALDLARCLSELGACVHLAVMGPALEPDQRAQALAIPELRLYESGFSLEWMEAPWPDVARAGIWLLELERLVEPDLVHLNGYCHGALAWRVPTLMVGHSCVMSWWEAVKREPPPPRWERYRAEVSRGIAGATRLVAPTRAMLDVLARLYGPHPRAAVIANGREWQPAPATPKEPFVLCAARLWDEAKNVATLARVGPGLRWPVLVAGDDTRPDGGRVTLPGVHQLGRLSAAALAHCYARAGVFALPARYEPFGLSALEAALAGCALVLGDIPTLRELWHGAALFVEPDDDVALAAALESLAGDRAARERLAARARARALSFDPAGMAGEYLEAYTAARAPRRRPPLLEASSWEEYTRATEPAPRIASLAG